MNKQEAIQQLRTLGLRITPQRQEILEILVQECHQSAEEIYQKVRRKFPHISLDTIYRNLNKLKELGFLTSIQLKDHKMRYEFNQAPHHHHHLICLNCGQREELNFCPLSYLDPKQLNNFMVKSHQFELFGYCNKCRS
ncbi:MAG: transcriptional repressor [Clostridia bacterium]|nr:transcriptional repressor [Clostridia bacterium]